MLKSTEIVIEQLIIGLLFIVIVVMFAWGNPLPLLQSGDDAYQTFIFGVLIVIAAYAAGIVVDRWSDTLLEQLERLVRIQVYLKNTSYRELCCSKTVSLPNEPSIRLEIQKKDDGIADHHDYLRRRMRISRAITCLMPAFFLALASMEYQGKDQEIMRWIIGGGVFFIYAFVLVYSIFLREENKVPKTHPTKPLCGYLKQFAPDDSAVHDKMNIEFHARHLANPATVGLIIFAISGVLLLVCLHNFYSPINTVKIFLYIGGIIVTCLVGWAWWRISKTYFTFLQHYTRFGRNE